MSWKDFFYYQKGERVAILLLLILIVLTMVMNGLMKRNAGKKVLIQNDSLVQEFDHFQRSFKDREEVDLKGNEKKRIANFMSIQINIRRTRIPIYLWYVLLRRERNSPRAKPFF